ncbi:hypothetical protein Salat_0853100 [Sesamum alatum]|uniref:Uncharacterized protein n=1 Tax=Sesamum alatum TaxID=300844 RepID=A0AAE1YIT8_9LAMI|nr:hypothetical protein Salat_0853100 [Sesamum alatum]
MEVDFGVAWWGGGMKSSGEAFSAADRAQVPWKRASERVRAPSCPDPIVPRGAVGESGCLGMQPQSGDKFRPKEGSEWGPAMRPCQMRWSAIGSRCGPARIEATAKARAVDMPAECRHPDCGGQRAPLECFGNCALPVLASKLPIRPVLKHGPRRLTCVRVNGQGSSEHACRDPKDGELCLSARSQRKLRWRPAAILKCKSFVGRRDCSVEPRQGIKSSKLAIFCKQNWRCGMNQKPDYDAQLHTNLDPTKSVGQLRQQEGGHGGSFVYLVEIDYLVLVYIVLAVAFVIRLARCCRPPARFFLCTLVFRVIKFHRYSSKNIIM